MWIKLWFQISKWSLERFGDFREIEIFFLSKLNKYEEKISFVFLIGALKVLSPHVTRFSQSGKKYAGGYLTSIQVFGAWSDGWRGRG